MDTCKTLVVSVTLSTRFKKSEIHTYTLIITARNLPLSRFLISMNIKCGLDVEIKPVRHAWWEIEKNNSLGGFLLTINIHCKLDIEITTVGLVLTWWKVEKTTNRVLI